MAPRVTHAKVSGKPVGSDPNRVYGTHWDADHVVTGLENVDNTSDLNKPISTATQAALDAKQPLDTDLTPIAALSRPEFSAGQAQEHGRSVRPLLTQN